LGDSDELAKVYHRLFDMEMAQNRWANASRYARQVLQVGQRIHSPRAIMQGYSALAQLYGTTKTPQQRTLPLQADSTFLYFQKVEQLARQLHDTVQIAYIASVYGGLLTDRNDARSIGYYKHSLALCTQTHKLAETINISLLLASAYLRFGQPDLAKPYLIYAQQTYKQQNLSAIGARLMLEQTSLDYYRAVGNWPLAYQQLETLRELEKSQFAADRDGAVSRLNVEYETEKREAQLRNQQTQLALQAQKDRVQQVLLLAFAVLLVGAAGTSVVFYRLNRKNQRISRQNAELVKEQNHRVKNNLQAVSSLLNLQSDRLTDRAAKRAVEETQLRVETMSLLHRRLYDGDRAMTLNLAVFVPELVTMGIDMFGYTDVNTIYNLPPLAITADQALPIGLIVTELVTNACKYAFPDNDTPCLTVAGHQKGQQLTLVISDNGLGLHTGRITQPDGGFGMQLIAIQVAQLDGVSQFSTDSGTRFTMTFTI